MKRGRRVLGDEEARLWAGVARSVLPLPGRRAPAGAEPPVPPAQPAAAEGPGDARNTALPGACPAFRSAPPPTAPALPPLHPIERPVRRKLVRGRLPIDASIDLHDMTESVAHHALLVFLGRARTAGLRHVLVITGRGASPGSRGALKRALPHWFDTAGFRGLVAGFDVAGRGHGGEGAFYVRLRHR